MLIRRCAFAAAAVAVASLSWMSARAHFVLRAPACYSEQDELGAPLKSAPCGQADPRNPVRLTGAVTTFVQGDLITVEIEEMINHPGHYRVALAPDMDSLPDDPPVTAGSTPCGSTVIDPSPTLPLLVDGALVHTSATTGPQTIEVQLPPDFSCDRCVLQIVQFMSNHALNDPGGCFYHHCAEVSIVPPGVDAGPSPDAGTSARDASVGPPAADSGCGCRVADRGPVTVPFALLFFGVLAVRRWWRHIDAR